MKPEKTSQFTARQVFVILPTGRQQREVELNGEQHNQFDPGG